MKQNTEQLLQDYLRNGEQVRWHGRTEPFALLEKDAKTQILAKWIGTVLVCGLILGLYISNNPGDWSKGMAGGIALIGVLLIVSPIMERKSIMGEEYWITDERAILMSKDQTFYSLALEDLDDFRLIEGKTPGGTLVLGSVIFDDIKRQLRWRACHPKTDVQSDGPSDAAKGLVFFCLEDGREAAECLRQAIAAKAA